jgi:hypothetical protein
MIRAPAHLDLRRAARQNRDVAHRLVLATAAALGLFACKRHTDPGPGATCDAVGTRFATVARAELAADKDLAKDLAQSVDGLIAPMRDGMVRACRENTWAAGARDCFVAAADEKSMKTCYAQLTPAQRTALDRAAAGKPTDSADEDSAPASR